MPFLTTVWVSLVIFTCGLSTAQSSAEVMRQGTHRAALSAVVRLTVPLQRNDGVHSYHVTEDCSGTLVDRESGMIVTAWHCFDGSMDLTQPPKVWLEGAWQEVRLGVNGGEMNSDWAIVYLVRPNILENYAMAYGDDALMPGAEVIMSGYQRDGSADTAQWIQATTSCVIIRHGKYWSETDCQLERGASGGAVMRLEGGRMRFIGVISAKSSGGGVLFVPLSRLGSHIAPP